jgi:hypothetical protein
MDYNIDENQLTRFIILKIWKILKKQKQKKSSNKLVKSTGLPLFH